MGWTNEAGKKCFLEVTSILDRLQVPSFLIQGTALGAYRDGGFVPNEKDIDIGILQEHLAPVARKLVNELMLAQFQVETFCLPFAQCRTIVAWKYGVHADLVGFIKWKEKRFTCSPVHPTVTKPYALVHESGLLENYKQCSLFGVDCNVPSPIETYLLREYGKKWQVPKDDHVSRTRVYNFIDQEGIPDDYLVSQP